MQKVGNTSVLISSAAIRDILKQETVIGKRQLEPLKEFAKAERMPFNILEDKEVVNDAEVHTHEADLWQCIEGEVTFTVGGTMVDPKVHVGKDGRVNENELKAKAIKGGTDVVLKRGDWLYIPAGEPHLHKTNSFARLVIIKIPNIL